MLVLYDHLTKVHERLLIAQYLINYISFAFLFHDFDILNIHYVY